MTKSTSDLSTGLLPRGHLGPQAESSLTVPQQQSRPTTAQTKMVKELKQWITIALNWTKNNQWVLVIAITLTLLLLKKKLENLALIDGVKDDKGNDSPLNLFKKFWYATMAPGILGLSLVLFGHPYDYIGWVVVGLQLSGWIWWYFTTTGDPAHWTIILVAGEMIGFRKAGRFMCPRIGKLLAYLDKSIRLQVQAVWGPRGKDKDGAEESGAELGVIRYSKMVRGNDPDPKIAWPHTFPEDDPLNLDTSEATPEVTLLVNIANPILVRRLDVRDKKDPDTRIRRGVDVAIGQVAESVRNGYQKAVEDRSAAWVPSNLKKIAEDIRNEIEIPLSLRGLKIEDPATMPAVTHYGETEAMRKNIAAINDAKVGGQAKIEASAKAADVKKEDARGAVEEAKGKAEARERLAQAVEKELKAKIQPLKDAKVTPSRIADILEQDAIKSGLPRLPKSVRDLIYGTTPGLWKDIGDTPATATVKTANSQPEKDGGKKK